MPEEATTWAEDSQHLGEGAPLVGREVQHAVRDDEVGGDALDRKLESVPTPQLDVGEPRLGCRRLRLAEHRFGHVDSDGAASWADRVCRQEKVRRRAASDVHDGRPCGERPHSERISHAGERLHGERRDARERQRVVPQEPLCVLGTAPSVSGTKSSRLGHETAMSPPGDVGRMSAVSFRGQRRAMR